MKAKSLLSVIVLAMISMFQGFAQTDPIQSGQFLIKEQQYNKAVDALLNAPESTQKNELLGEAYFKLGKADLALAAFQKAAADPLSFNATCGLAAIDLKKIGRSVV